MGNEQEKSNEQERRLCGNPACQRYYDENAPCALLMLRDTIKIQNYRDNPEAVEQAKENCAFYRDAEELEKKAGLTKMEEG